MRVLVIAKDSALTTYAESERVALLLKRKDPSVRRMRRAHESHRATVEEVIGALDKMKVKYTLLTGTRSAWRGAFDLVVTVGGDGTLLAASHGVGTREQLLGVNSAPTDSVGFFCAATKGHVAGVLRAALDHELPKIVLTRMLVARNGEILHRRVLNEALYCHASPAATSRYILLVQDGRRTRTEEQKSSGLWIGPPAGSTAAQSSAGGRVLPLTARKIQFVVREAYIPAGGRLALPKGTVGLKGEITMLTKMSEAKVFIDGVHTELDCALGDTITMRASDEPLTVLGLLAKKPASR